MDRPFEHQEALKALSHPARLEFLAWLKEPEVFFGLPASAIDDGVSAGCFARSGLSQSAASLHLAILQRAGLVKSRRAGAKMLYRRNEKNISLLKDWFERNI